MRRVQIPQRPKADEVRMRASEQPSQPTRKLFNCIVDDTALIAGVKKSTRDGIRKWVSQGAIRLFVPLYTLTQLDRLKKGTERINTDAREAIKWLDEITSIPAVETTGRVQLEGVEEVYNTWEEVEKFLLPETLLSMEDIDSDEDDYNEELESSFNALDVSDETSMSSTHSLDGAPKSPRSHKSSLSTGSYNFGDNTCFNPKAVAFAMESPDRTARNSAEMPRPDMSLKGSVPIYLRPLFNHILWRINKEFNPTAALGYFILLTNDPAKHAVAQKFGIRAKRLEQLRDAVGREDREFKNRLTVHKLESETNKPRVSLEKEPAKETPTVLPTSRDDKNADESDDGDEILLKRAPRGPQAQTANSQRIWDPNEFGRTNQHRGGRGGRGGFGAPRGRGMPRGGRGGFVPRGGAYVAPAPLPRPPPAPRVDPNQPIDPNSFARPSPRTTITRGTRRKLWEPN